SVASAGRAKSCSVYWRSIRVIFRMCCCEPN
ncbi:hypothetical protein, partial [Escherichia coli]